MKRTLYIICCLYFFSVAAFAGNSEAPKNIKVLFQNTAEYNQGPLKGIATVLLMTVLDLDTNELVILKYNPSDLKLIDLNRTGIQCKQ
jgi:hypothetical protein